MLLGLSEGPRYSSWLGSRMSGGLGGLLCSEDLEPLSSFVILKRKTEKQKNRERTREERREQNQKKETCSDTMKSDARQEERAERNLNF